MAIKVNGKVVAGLGIAGKSAYDAAVDGGYQGTELEYNEKMANVASKGDAFEVQLISSSWSDNSQTISDARFVSQGYTYITNPADDSFGTWGEATIRGMDVTADGQMTFVCQEIPSANITVKIIRLEANEA